MYWKFHVLTKTGKELTLSLVGRKEQLLKGLESDHLTLITMAPDVRMTFKHLLHKGMLPSAQLSLFFIDFSRMMQSGLSVTETMRSLSEISLDPQIKTGLEKAVDSINDGHSLKASFENAGIFPKTACVSIGAAEISGQIPEISRKLGEYFACLDENKNKIIGSLIYPIFVFIALTMAAVLISINLIPQLSFLLTPNQMNSLSIRFIMGYAYMMKEYWWLLIIGFILGICGIWHAWNLNRDKLIKYVFEVPILGVLLKEVEFAHIFLNLYIYTKSGISTMEALGLIHAAQDTFVTHKLMDIRDRVHAGSTLGEAFAKDPFFPPFIQQSLKKGEEAGKRTEYLYEAYKYYDSKSKDSIKAFIKLINPFLMSLAFAFAGFIASFYVLIYRNMAAMGADIYH